ncbi:hypothetical protein MYX78_06330 [Acidobacteria bacterium AH-259-G07]|nr:hypothetical protein [Acidobacteria bacterium AH-259-G07]
MKSNLFRLTILILPVVASSTLTNSSTGEQATFVTAPERPAFTLWALGDPHLQTDLDSDPPYRSLEAAIKDSRLGGDQGGESFKWDISIITGDYTGRLQCPGDRDGQDLIDQFDQSGADPNYFYGSIKSMQGGAVSRL